MFIKVDLHAFREAFRHIRPDNFSYEGLGVLFNYLEELEHCEEPYELDVIALCCDFAESDALTIANDYSIDLGDYKGVDLDQDEDAKEAVTGIVREHLEDEGALVGEPFEGTYVYRNF